MLQTASTGEVRLSEVADRLAKDFQLTEEDKSHLLPSGRQTTLSNRIGWAKTYLAKAGLVTTTRRGYFRATERGRDVLSRTPPRIDITFLSQFPEFEEFRKTGMDEPTPTEPIAKVVQGSNQTPDELLRATHREIEKTLRAELLDRLLQASPTFFENLIVTLLVSMGYGGSREDAGRAIGRTGDNGLDGIIDQDPLGLDCVYIQAKRYKLDNSVSEPDIRGFAGSLEGANVVHPRSQATSFGCSPRN